MRGDVIHTRAGRQAKHDVSRESSKLGQICTQQRSDLLSEFSSLVLFLIISTFSVRVVPSLNVWAFSC